MANRRASLGPTAEAGRHELFGGMTEEFIAKVAKKEFQHLR